MLPPNSRSGGGAPRGCLTMIPLPARGELVRIGSSVIIRPTDDPRLIWAHAPGILFRLAPEPPVVVISLDSEALPGKGGTRVLHFPTPVWGFGRLVRYWWKRSRDTTVHLLTLEMARSFRQRIRYQPGGAGEEPELPGDYLVKMVCRPAGSEAVITKPHTSLNLLMGQVADACLWRGLTVKLDFPPLSEHPGRERQLQVLQVSKVK